MLEKIKQTADFIKNIIQETPDFAIVLGSGLGKLQDEVEAIHILNTKTFLIFHRLQLQAIAENLSTEFWKVKKY
jgi:purine nucleoside phosphorylase